MEDVTLGEFLWWAWDSEFILWAGIVAAGIWVWRRNARQDREAREKLAHIQPRRRP